MNESRLAKLPRMEFQSEYPDEVIHVSKRHYDGITKKVNIIKIRPVSGIGGKVIIEYTPKNGKGHGVLELNDIGPVPIKKEN